MKLIDALSNVLRENACTPNFEAFFKSVGLDAYHASYEQFATDMREYYLMGHQCTDAYVGLGAVYLRGELIACASQPHRKSDYEIKYINHEAALKTRDYLMSIMEEPEKSFPILDSDETHMEIPDFYSLDYASEIVDEVGKHGERWATVIKRIYRWEGNKCENKLIIKYDDTGEETSINPVEFEIPLKINKGQ